MTAGSGADPGLTVAVGGLGAIGLAVARRLDAGIQGLRLVAVTARDRDKARAKMADFATPVPVVGLEDLAERADVVVECAPAAVFAALAESAIEQGRILVPVSVGALLGRGDLVARARETGAQILVPSGALLGLDAVRAAGEGEIRRVTMVTRKPPAALAGAPYLQEHGIDLAGLAKPLKIFEGSAGEGARGFPANVNVAAALSLAGIGAERTRLEIWADPTVSRNTHTIEV
jgi:aspartate dehydrogenase